MGWLEGGLSFIGGVMTNQANAKQAEYNRNYQMQMSNTAHQREVNDLRAAGLNPILSATGGMGASSPSGSVAIMQDPISPAIKAKNESSLIDSQIVSLFAQAASANAQSELLKAQSISESNRPAYIEAQTNLAGAQSASAYSQANLTRVQQDRAELELGILDQLKNTKIDMGKMDALIQKREYDILIRELNAAKNEGDIDSTKFGKVMRYVDRLKNAISPWSPNSRRGSIQINNSSRSR